MNKIIYKTFEENARIFPEKIAIQAPIGKDLSYAGLEEQVKKLRLEFESLGVGPGARVAVVLPKGPEVVILSLALISFAAICPLNPKYKHKEFEFYLSDLKPQALVVLADSDSPAIEVAKKLNIKVIEILGEKFSTVGICSLKNSFVKNNQNNIKIKEKNIALVLHTSGTTNRPKIVPLSQKNIFISALNTVKTLRLSERDKCLNVMPLFHIHGFIVTMATFISGGTIICPGEFLAPDFFVWARQFNPTWYTASPTIHQAILKEASKQGQILSDLKLRFIRSSSAPLSPEIIKNLEETFQAPVAESYGMTEASLQITSNQLPPGKRKPGSAGIADGPELLVIDENNEPVGVGEVGEIIIRGDNVTSGYENNLEANQENFFNDWFRTGDLGYLDADNFLFITGRKKEMINKGGENISPREIDEVLMTHPQIEQAVVFSVPHQSLGEEVGAAVILKKEKNVSAEDIKKFVASSLADFKIPQVIFFVTDIPKTPTGKFQRVGLYEKLKENEKKLNVAQNFSVDKNEILEKILKIWKEILEVENLSLEDNFFELGGDSLKMREIVSRLQVSGIGVEVEDLLNHPSVSSLVKKLS